MPIISYGDSNFSWCVDLFSGLNTERGRANVNKGLETPRSEEQDLVNSYAIAAFRSIDSTAFMSGFGARAKELLQVKTLSLSMEFSGSFAKLKSVFSSLNRYERDACILGGGICVGITLHHISQIFKQRLVEGTSEQLESALLSSMLFTLDHPKTLKKRKMSFIPFNPIKRSNIDNLSIYRFLQAAYDLSDSLRSSSSKTGLPAVFRESSSEIIASKVLKIRGIQVIRTIPEIKKNGKKSLKFDQLMDFVSDTENAGKVFLLGMSFSNHSHSIAMSLRAPIHFLDPSWGIGIVDTQDELPLLLGAFLTNQYSGTLRFALVELASLS